MGYVFSSPAGLITLFAMMMQTTVAVILAFSTGLSELHKDLLVGFAVGFPALSLVLLLVMLSRSQTPEVSDPESP